MTIRLTVIFCLLASLTACLPGGSNDDLKEYIKITKDKDYGDIEEFSLEQSFSPFTYAALELRSPFEPPEAAIIKQQIVRVNSSGVKPDQSRTKEYLERFNFLDINMVGTFEKNGVLWALMNDPQGQVTPVRAGYYLGKDHGKIKSIQPGRIEVIEVVSNGGGWLERPRGISLQVKE